MANDNPISVGKPILGQELLLFTLLGLLLGVLLELTKHVRVAILLVVFLRVNNHMHSIALIANLPGRDKVRANWTIFWKISRKVHLLPLELLFDVICPGEAELSKMPTFDKVYLAILRLVINAVWMTLD